VAIFHIVRTPKHTGNASYFAFFIFENSGFGEENNADRFVKQTLRVSGVFCKTFACKGKVCFLLYHKVRSAKRFSRKKNSCAMLIIVGADIRVSFFCDFV